MKRTDTTDIQKLEALTRGQVSNICLLQEWREQTNNTVILALIDELLLLTEGKQLSVEPINYDKGLQELNRLINSQHQILFIHL